MRMETNEREGTLVINFAAIDACISTVSILLSTQLYGLEGYFDDD